MERESMEFDVVIVGAGPAGLSAAELTVSKPYRKQSLDGSSLP